MPPVAVTDWEYAWLTVPPGRLVVVMVGAGAGAIVIESACVSVWAALSVTWTVKL